MDAQAHTIIPLNHEPKYADEDVILVTRIRRSKNNYEILGVREYASTEGDYECLYGFI